MLVSIIITNYNYSKYINRCLRSCLNQTMSIEKYEIILVDDCSTDNIKEVLNDYKNFRNIKIIYNKKNKGVSYSANRAIKEAKGKYFIRIDADDYVSKEFLNIMYFYLNQHKEKFCVACDYFFIDKNEKKISQEDSSKNPISCGIMYNRKKFIKYGMYNVKFRHREEEELRIRLDSKYKIHNLNIPLYRYRLHKKNKTRSSQYQKNYRNKINKLFYSKFLKIKKYKEILSKSRITIFSKNHLNDSENLKNIFFFTKYVYFENIKKNSKDVIYSNKKLIKNNFFNNSFSLYLNLEHKCKNLNFIKKAVSHFLKNKNDKIVSIDKNNNFTDYFVILKNNQKKENQNIGSINLY